MLVDYLLARTRRSPPPFPEEVFQQRLPVWWALSDLFLDTSSDFFYIGIARAWRAAGLSREELRTMLFDEVAPRFYVNLTVSAGVWDGFSLEEVELQMRRQLRTSKKVERLHRGNIERYLEQQWACLSPYLDAVEAGNKVTDVSLA